MPSQPSNRKPLAPLYWSLFGSIALAATLVVATFWLVARNQTEEDWVRHSLTVRDQLEAVLLLVQRAESSQRGYLLTGRNVYLVPHDAAVAALPAALDKAASLVSGDAPQREAVDTLRPLIADKLRELRQAIEEQKAGHNAAALTFMNTDEGRRSMDAIRDQIAAMEARENGLLSEQQARAATFASLLRIGVAAAFVLICAIGALTGYFTRRSFREIARGRDQVMVANEELREQMSRREQAEAQLRQAQKMEAIGQLTGGIAHDFNNMLGVIRGSLDLMQRRMVNGDFAIEQHTEAAGRATDRAAVLTHRLLAFARQQPLAPQPIRVDKLIAGMTDLLCSTLGRHISIETLPAAGLWMTNADPYQLESALLNIAINARDAMPDGGRLTIETGNAYLDEAYCRQSPDIEPGQYVMIAINDTGSGMTPETIARAFDPFFTTKPAGKGTGLGLSQVYGFIKQSHGHIRIYSEHQAGTTVKIYLPRLYATAELPKDAAQRSAQTGDIGEVILVVEDDALMRRLSTDALRELGYTVVHRENAAAALATLDTIPRIKLLFTDVVMPEMNGRQLADEALRRRPDLRVLFTTGYTHNAVVHGGVLDPGVNLLSKPFSLEQLATKIRTVLDA